VYAVAAQWSDIHRALGRVGIAAPAVAFVAALAGLGASALSWRALLADFDVRLPWPTSLRVFYLGQLGKYLPGGVWPVVAQMELGHAAGAARKRVGAVALVVMGVNVTTGLVVAVVTLPFVSAHALHRAGWLLVLLPVGLLLLHPRVLGTLVDRGLRIIGREPVVPSLAQSLSWRAVLTSASWSVVMWGCYGVHIALLAHPLASKGHHHLTLLAIGGYAVAWVVGFLVVIAPAGVGAREAMLVVALSPALVASAATSVALVSRLVMTAADFALAAAFAAAARGAKRPEVSESSFSRG
jgi:hypothetical protein